MDRAYQSQEHSRQPLQATSHSLHWCRGHYEQTGVGSVGVHDSDHASREWFWPAQSQAQGQVLLWPSAQQRRQMLTL